MKKFTIKDIIKGLLFTILSLLFLQLSIGFTIYVIKNHETLALKEWIHSIFFFVVCRVGFSTVFSKINENRNERASIQKIPGEVKTDDKGNMTSLTYTLGSAPLLWIIGAAVLLIGRFKNHHMFYAYFYFFATGLFPLAYSLLKQIVVDGNGLRLFMGNFFNRKCIILSWNQISSMAYTTYETTHMSSAGGRISVPYKVTRQNEGLVIDLKKQLPLPIQTLIKKSRADFLAMDEIDFESEKHLILLKRPPSGGFKALLNIINQYSDVEIGVEKETAFDIFIRFFAYSTKFIFIAIALFGLYFFRYVGSP